MLTLDDAIQHTEMTVHEEELKSGSDTDYECYKMSDSERIEYKKNAEEHRQMAAWLKELKNYKNLYPTPKIGRWIFTTAKDCTDELVSYFQCSECERIVGETLDNTENNLDYIYKEFPYCHCGARMVRDADK